MDTVALYEPDKWHWTPLMHALLEKNSELALDLIPYSDVIAISAKPRPPEHIKRPSTRIGFCLHGDREHPISNALFIARDQIVPELTKIEDGLFQRAEEQDAEWGKVDQSNHRC